MGVRCAILQFALDHHVLSSKSPDNRIAMVCAGFIHAIAEGSISAGRQASLQIHCLAVYSYLHRDSVIIKPSFTD